MLIVGMTMAFHPMLLSGFAHAQADPADSRLLNYVLEHGHRWLGGEGDLWNPNYFYPQRNAAAFSEVMLGLLPFYSLWRWAGLPPDSAFQGWMLTMGALNYLAAWLFFRRALSFGAPAAAFGAFLFSFGASRLAQLGHQQLLPHFFTVLALHALVRLFQGATPQQSRFWIAVFFASVTLQIHSGVYHGWFLCFVLGLSLLWAMVLREQRERLWSVVRLHPVAWVAGAVGMMLSLVPLAQPYLLAAREVGYRSFSEAEGMLPRFQSWFHMGWQSWLYGWTASLRPFRTLPMEWEHRLGLGAVTTVVMVVSLWRERHRPLVKLMVAVSVSAILLVSYYRWGFSFWRGLFHLVPGANALRAVSRMGLLLLIPASLGLAYFVERFHAHRRRWLVLLFAAVSVLEQGQRAGWHDKLSQRADVETLAARIPGGCEAFFYAPVQSAKSWEVTHLDAIWVAMLRGIPTVNGYSGNFPRGWEDLIHHNITTPEDEQRLRSALGQWEQSHQLSEGSVCWVSAP